MANWLFIVAISFVLKAVHSNKSDKWPPAVIYRSYDNEAIVKKCAEECHVNLDEVKEFELTRDMQNLPKSPEIRCYFYCGWIEYKLMKRGSTTFYPSTLFDLMEEMTEEEQKKYFKLIRGCAKRISRIKDPVEVSYQARVCEKENDPDLFYIFY